MKNWEHILEVVRLTVGSFTVSARILRKKLYQQYKEYVSENSFPQTKFYIF